MKWRRIQDFPEYEVSDTGLVRSWRHPIDGRIPHLSYPHLLKPHKGERGYLAVILRVEGSAKTYRRLVHRLVAQAFIPNPDGLPDVAHQNGNPPDCHVQNLRWSTHVDNQMDMRRHGTMQDGEKSVTAKLTVSQIAAIRHACKLGPRGTQRRLAAAHGISVAQISRIVNGKRWRSTLEESQDE